MTNRAEKFPSLLAARLTCRLNGKFPICESAHKKSRTDPANRIFPLNAAIRQAAQT